MGLTIIDTLSDGSQVTQVSGDVSVVVKPASSSSISAAVGSTVSAVLMAANPARQGFTLFNEGNRVAYVALAETASTASFSIKMPGGSFYDGSLLKYTGDISAVWDAAGATMRVTEII